MRRGSQSVRHYSRPSLALVGGGAVDDLGILQENEDSVEDVLRKQLMDKERECDKLQLTIQALQDQLAQRPPIERIQEIQKEHKNLELLLQGTLRENEKCMSDLERAKNREKMLERELARIAGENWQANLEIAPPLPSSRPSMMHQRSNTISSPLTLNVARHTYSPSPSPRPDSRVATQSPDHPQQPLNLAQIEQVRMLILGMEQRLQVREQKLAEAVERAENAGRRVEALRSEIVSDT